MSWAASLRSKSIEALIVLHDLGRAGGEPAAPHRVAHEAVALDGSRMTKTENCAAPPAPPAGRARRARGRRRRGRPIRDGGAARQGRGGLSRRLEGARGATCAAREGRSRGARGRVRARAGHPARLRARGRQQGDRSPISAAARCCSTSGRPGACPAGRKCRRSTVFRRRGRRQGFRGRRGQCRHRAARAPRRVSRRDRRQVAHALRRSERRRVRDPARERARRSACRSPC